MYVQATPGLKLVWRSALCRGPVCFAYTTCVAGQFAYIIKKTCSIFTGYSHYIVSLMISQLLNSRGYYTGSEILEASIL